MFISQQVGKSRKLSPISLNENGDICCSSRSAQRRRSETITAAAKLLHGATSENMIPAYEGLCAALTLNAPLSQLRSAVIKCPRFTNKVLPNIVREKIKCFESSRKILLEV